ncbi:MAG: GAF domain-containing protein [Candidatus Rokubacteria bacterium]|nr:GAF domain-containing protein [Candidatus Rokubacteria bacterium]
MRRPVFYDARSPAASSAVSLLTDEFEVRPLGAGSPGPGEPSVVLIDADTPGSPTGGTVRVLALVDPAATGPWPDEWWALLPRGVSGPVLARTVRNAFGDLDATAEVARLGRELGDLNAIGIRLSSERNPAALLETILSKAREITQSDAGSLYLVEEMAGGGRHLRFALAQNDSMEIPFQTALLPLTSESVAGHVALTGEAVNLGDAYAPPPGSPFRINPSFDERAGYLTKSMLVVPMWTPQGETIGALQLINCKRDPRMRFASKAEIERHVQPFDARFEKLAGSLASQAAVALQNNRLYESIQRLFEGFVRAAVIAIESRDPTTSGHSFRVADLTVGLAEVVDGCQTGPYRALRFTADELMELRYASLLHDFGKVGVREQVLVKAKKFYPGELERIRQRVELIKRGLELRYARKKLEYLLTRGQERYAEQAAVLDAELGAALAELDDTLDRIVTANEPTVLPRDVVTQIQQIPQKFFEDHRGNRRAVITPDEARALAITKGSLTVEEYRELQSHVVHTFQFLAQIPWTREFRRIPEIARAHHEKLNGSGYPYGLKSDEIPVQSKMMAIGDIFDALTAGDRPYKGAVPVEAALDILGEERVAGNIDRDLLDLFIEAKVYERTRRD